MKELISIDTSKVCQTVLAGIINDFNTTTDPGRILWLARVIKRLAQGKHLIEEDNEFIERSKNGQSMHT